MKYTINVTEQNIKDAKMLCNSGHARARCCPVALAAKEAGMWRDVYVSSKHIVRPMQYDGVLGVWNRFEPVELPEIAAGWVDAFDLDQPVHPFSFELEVPDAQEGAPRP